MAANTPMQAKVEWLKTKQRHWIAQREAADRMAVKFAEELFVAENEIRMEQEAKDKVIREAPSYMG